jgi:hypothetical protein
MRRERRMKISDIEAAERWHYCRFPQQRQDRRMHDDRRQARDEPKHQPFRRQAHSFGAEHAHDVNEKSEMRLRTRDVKDQKMGEGQRELPLVGVAKQSTKPKARK